jgi:peroxiredoxin
MNAGETRPRENILRLLTILVVFIVAVFLIVLFSEERDSTVTTTQPIQLGLEAPNFTFPDLNGQRVTLLDHRGKVVLVNIWASWCPPCRQEMPSMQRLYEKFRGKNLEILAVSIDSNGREAVAPLMRKIDLTFPVLLDPKETIKPLYGITGVPESFIVDKEGILVKKIIGPIDWATPEVFLFFRDLMQESRS